MKCQISRLQQTSWLSSGIKVNLNLGIADDADTKTYVIYHTNLPYYYYTQSL